MFKLGKFKLYEKIDYSNNFVLYDYDEIKEHKSIMLDRVDCIKVYFKDGGRTTLYAENFKIINNKIYINNIKLFDSFLYNKNLNLVEISKLKIIGVCSGATKIGEEFETMYFELNINSADNGCCMYIENMNFGTDIEDSMIIS